MPGRAARGWRVGDENWATGDDSCVDGFSVVNVYFLHVYLPPFSCYPFNPTTIHKLTQAPFPCSSFSGQSTMRAMPSEFLLTRLVNSRCCLFSEAVLLLRTVHEGLHGYLSSTAAACKLEASLSVKAVAPSLLRTWAAGDTPLHHGS